MKKDERKLQSVFLLKATIQIFTCGYILKNFSIQRSNDLVELQRFWSFEKLLRIILYVLRFAVSLLKRKHEHSLYSQDHRKSNLLLLCMKQKKCFLEEYSQLKTDESLAEYVKFCNLTTLIDTELGVIRVGKRFGPLHYQEDKNFLSVHVEILSSLPKTDFKLGFERLIARRRLPRRHQWQWY